MILAVAYNWDFGLVLSFTPTQGQGLVSRCLPVGTVLGGMVIGVICGLRCFSCAVVG